MLVDTTCGSVLNVWKMVHRCARDGFTVVIHGKHYHEETRATASQALMHEAVTTCACVTSPRREIVCAFLAGRRAAAASAERFADAASPGFDPDRDLQRIGLANQTTMLMTRESGDPGDAAHGDAGPLRRCGARASLPCVRHDLFRHAGSAGRRAARCSTRATST